MGQGGDPIGIGLNSNSYHPSNYAHAMMNNQGAQLLTHNQQLQMQSLQQQMHNELQQMQQL